MSKISIGSFLGIAAAEITYQVIRSSGVVLIYKSGVKGIRVVTKCAEVYKRKNFKEEAIFNDAMDAVLDAF